MKVSQESPFTVDVPFPLSKCLLYLALNKLVQYSNILKYPLDVSSVEKRQKCMKWIFFLSRVLKQGKRGHHSLYSTGNYNTGKNHEGQGYDVLGMDKYLIDLVLSRDRTAERLRQHLVKEAQP